MKLTFISVVEMERFETLEKYLPVFSNNVKIGDIKLSCKSPPNPRSQRELNNAKMKIAYTSKIEINKNPTTSLGQLIMLVCLQILEECSFFLSLCSFNPGCEHPAGCGHNRGRAGLG